VQASRPRLSPLLPHIHALDNILHVQASINRPLTPRPLSNLHPQPPKALDIMPIRSRPLAQPAILARLYSPNLPPHHHRPRPRLHKSHEPAGDNNLLRPREQMQQTAGMHDVNLALQLGEAGSLVQQAAAYERGAGHLGPVEEKVVAELEEGRLKVEPV